MESWEPSEHLLIGTGKPRKTCVEVAGRRTLRILTSSQRSGINCLVFFYNRGSVFCAVRTGSFKETDTGVRGLKIFLFNVGSVQPKEKAKNVYFRPTSIYRVRCNTLYLRKEAPAIWEDIVPPFSALKIRMRKCTIPVNQLYK